jgi:hypothetical protein
MSILSKAGIYYYYPLAYNHYLIQQLLNFITCFIV